MAVPICHLALWTCLGTVVAAQPAPSEAVRTAELAFAEQAAREGIRRAFLTWLLPEARVFRPAAATAQAAYGAEPGDPGALAWYPEANAAAASEDLAWSTGPWSYAARPGGAPLAHGHFLSLWQKQPGGAWRVIADIGVPHPAPGAPIPQMAPASPPARKAALPPSGPALEALRRAESGLAAGWRRSGGSALHSRLGAGGRVYRAGFPPLGPGPALEGLLAGEGPGDAGVPRTVQVSASGDLGWTWGETESGAQGRRASFLRVWERNGGAWKVRFDVRLPHPPKGAR